MASLPNLPDDSTKIQDLKYLYASNSNVSNFVTVKLSGDHNYHLWKKQMLCLMKIHDMCGLVDDDPTSMKIMNKYDSLLQGWIFGSVSEEVLGVVVDLDSAKDVWKKLESCYDSTMSSKKGYTDSSPTKVDKEIETNVEKAETETKTETDVYLRQLIRYEHWDGVYFQLIHRNEITKKINSDGNTLLHIVVKIRDYKLTYATLWSIHDHDLTEMKNKDGSTVLHIAAIVGNTDAAELLVKKNKRLLYIKDNKGKTPLDKAKEHGHLNTIAYLEEAPKKLRQLIAHGDWNAVYDELRERDGLTEKINSDGNTLLHIAVQIGDGYLINKILQSMYNDDLTEIKNKDGSTVLHIAAIVGNTYAAELLFNKNRNLWNIHDNEGKTPLDKAKENGHLRTIAYLQEAPKKWRQLIVDGDWDAVYDELYDRNKLKEKINSDGNTLLHIVVGIGDNDLISAILRSIRKDDLTEMKNLDGSTVLHIAAIVGNTKAAERLVKKNERLLHIPDKKGQTPLDKAYENMHLDMIAYLLEAAEKDKKESQEAGDVDGTRSTLLPSVEIGVDLLVNAISAKRYDFASELISRNPEYALSNDNVLMAIARTFPSGLDYGERLIYPSMDNISEMIVKRTKRLFNLIVEISSSMKERTWSILCYNYGFRDSLLDGLWFIFAVPVAMVYCIYHLIPFVLLLMVYFPFFMVYLQLWKVAATVVPPIKNIEQKKKEYKEAKNVLELVLETIIEKRPGSSRDLYTGPIIEAACQDAYEVVDQILGRWPEAIRCKDKNDYDIIQLATIYRSERIYNLIYIIGERKSIYRTIQDSSKNNMLHLAGRLAPSNKLKRRTGAALQLQRELQWRQEVEKLVFPTYVTKENIFLETPEMVFTKEHENLVKEGEKWIKTVAESCSITAALITTIVFAAAITVPGGSNQDTGIPVFTKQTAFTIFAIADAISLSSSATALLVFLSILTARFAQQDFLVRLPRRLIIGLYTLLISTTAMMVAFSATLFLVFSHQKLWVLAPICALALLPNAFFFVLQFPLILDLLRSTYMFKFGKSDNKSSKLVQNDIRFIFSK